MLKYNVFGKKMSVIRKDEQWMLYRDSDTSMRQRVYDIVIPAEMPPSEIKTYLDDMYHEYATKLHQDVFEIK